MRYETHSELRHQTYAITRLRKHQTPNVRVLEPACFNKQTYAFSIARQHQSQQAAGQQRSFAAG